MINEVNKKTFGSLAFFLAITMMALASTSIAQTTETYVVTPANPQGWGFLAEGLGGPTKSSGDFVNGPATPPLGGGSAMLSTVDGTGGHVLGTIRYGGLRMADITELKYSSYGNLTPQSIALQFDVDSNLTDAITGFQGRLVFEPYQAYGNAAVIPNTWTEWETLAGGKWWGTGSGQITRPVSNMCPQSNPCTTAALLSAFPNIGVRDPGGFYFKAGSGWLSAFTGNVDKLIIGINNGLGVDTTTWDFELNSRATDPEQCKKGGYLLFNPPTGPYKNQGQCVSSAVPQ